MAWRASAGDLCHFSRCMRHGQTEDSSIPERALKTFTRVMRLASSVLIAALVMGHGLTVWLVSGVSAGIDPGLFPFI